MLISDLLARSAVTSHNHKLWTKPFWRPPRPGCQDLVLVNGSPKHTPDKAINSSVNQ